MLGTNWARGGGVGGVRSLGGDLRRAAGGVLEEPQPHAGDGNKEYIK